MHVCVCACVHACVGACMCACMRVCMCVCVCVNHFGILPSPGTQITDEFIAVTVIIIS